MGTIPFYWIDKSTSYWIIAIVLLVRGIGAGGILSPLMTDSYTGMDRSQVPSASIGSRIIQNIGSALGSALITTVVMAYSNSQVKHFKDALQNGHYHVQPDQMKSFMLQHMQAIQIHSFQYGFLVVSIAALVILIPTMLLTNKKK
ncbi:drug resistance transporter, EmrB/QacA subfamily [Lentilactobacillus kosonis]|uniref:Drug resistance transporter, EmrB/QacA subfamily n=1 Tax=Lentilactobacillus kosonis TaxID=2810561 RepID=A0A401FHX0_9LACO|nr:drug resistance transporter, EmrB/QacA subfamily [Lentilactobacillus kosonis]